MSKVVELTSQLVRFPSVSRISNWDVASFVADRLRQLDFTVETTQYQDASGIDKHNVVAVRGTGSGGLAYFAHNDVVPADSWSGPQTDDPFDTVQTDTRLYGRGTCDMKGSLAAMICAAENVSVNQQSCPLWIVVTADEEVGFGGAKNVTRQSQQYRKMVDQQPVGIIGEPTLLEVVHAHKGITGFTITSHGKAAHSSSRDGVSATLPMIPVLSQLKEIYERTESDPSLQDDRYDPPTLTWNVGFRGGNNAVNVTPDWCQAWVSLRTMPGVDGSELVAEVRQKAQKLGFDFSVFEGSGPLWVEPNAPFVQDMLAVTGTSEPKTVCYGTDGGVFTEILQKIVCGPGDIAQAHTVDEWIDLQQLECGIEIYEKAIRKWCCQS